MPPPEPRVSGAWVRGEAALLDRALDRAAELLHRARLPLITGLVDSTTGAQRRAVEVADLVGGVVDPLSGTPVDPGFPRIGRVTATLGEIRGRADLVIFWGVDPDAVHAGFTERYLRPAGGRKSPARIAVDVGEARGPADIGTRVRVQPDREIEALCALRARVRRHRLDDSMPDRLGAPPEQLEDLARRLTGSRYCVVLYDAAPARPRSDPLRATCLAALIRDANDRAPARLVGIRGPGNAQGAEAVLTWQTGFPGAVHLGRGYPRHAPGEYTADALLARDETDAVLLVGAVPAAGLSAAAAEQLRRTLAVALGPPDPRDEMAHAEVRIATAPLAQSPGSVYRMDGVAVRNRPAADAGIPTQEEVLAGLVEHIRALRHGGAR